VGRGQESPILLKKSLISKELILGLAEEHFKGTDLYVTGLKISADNHINVFIDGDKGVTIKDCVGLSRAIEGHLDRANEDFALDVSSHGATTPLVMPRQYKKHLGRDLEIRLTDGTRAEGKLTAFDGEGLEIEYSVRENKPIGKGKITVVKQQKIKYEEIKESKIKLKF
jgi:ribosome maturation factor RimP